MAEGYAPSINDIVKALSEDPRYMRFKSKFTEKNVRDAIITLKYADKEGNYNFSDRGMTEFGHLGKIADKIIETFPESKSKKKRRRRRGKKTAKGGLRGRRN